MRIPKPLRLVGEATRVGQKMAQKPAAYLHHTPSCCFILCCLAARSPTSTYRLPLVMMSCHMHTLDAGRSFKWRWTWCWLEREGKEEKKKKNRRKRKKKKIWEGWGKMTWRIGTNVPLVLTNWFLKFFFSMMTQKRSSCPSLKG